MVAIVSFIGSFRFLCLVADREKTSCYIFLICLINSSCFVFLNIIVMFDLVFNNQEGFQNFSGFISKYYDIFDYIDKALGFLIYIHGWLNFLRVGIQHVIWKLSMV